MLSLIIPTKNEQQNISHCLESIKQQNFSAQEIETVVIDNNSTDQTKKIARQYTNKVFNCGPERSVQRNFGAHKAQGEILGFIDADMILSPGVIQEVAEKFAQDKDLAGLYINEKITNIPTGFPPDGRAGSQGLPPLKGVRNFFCKVRDFERQFYNMTPIDAARFMRREDFFAAGGFDEKLFACEDWDLHKRLIGKRKTDILKAIIYHNEKEKTLRELIQKKSYYTGSFKNYINKWGRNDADVKKQFGFWYRYFGVFIENGKWRRLLQHPILAAAMFVSRTLIGIMYATKTLKHLST